MIWLTLVLAAGPLDDVPPLLLDGRAVEASATPGQPVTSKNCVFTPRTLSDASVHQWVASCPVEFVQLVVDHRLAVVRLFTQGNIWRLLAFDGARVAEFDDPGDGKLPNAPAWVPPAMVSALIRKQKDGGATVAKDPRDGSTVMLDWQRGYLRSRAGQQTPLFTPNVPMSPLHALWFTSKAAEPWLFWGDDPWRKLDFFVRAPDGTTKNVFSRAPRPNGGDYRATSLTHVMLRDERSVFSLLVDRRHLVLWPREDGTWAPLVHGVSVGSQPPSLEPRGVPPCASEEKQVFEEQVVEPALFTVRDEVWAAWVSDETQLRWALGPVWRVGADGGPSCDWVLEGRSPHRALVLAKFTREGKLEEKKRIPIAGAVVHLAVETSGDVVTLATSAYGLLTLTQIELR
ncbi:MAG: hypothetical protein QM817_01400 [Archangium sp.]